MVSILIVFSIFLGVCHGAPNLRIVGGTPTTVQNYPSIVQVEDHYPASDFWRQMCGGSILTNFVVLSAAHCFNMDDMGPNFYRIRAGATYLERGGTVNYVTDVIIHPYYADEAVAADADICIVRLRDILVYGDTINYISIIPQDFKIPNNTVGTYAGWGFLASDVDGSDVLLHVNVNILDHENCERIFEEPIHTDVVCAGYSGRGVCWGDSGGPLYYGGVLAGIISWTPDCGHDYLPSGNTAVASYTNWIVSNQ